MNIAYYTYPDAFQNPGGGEIQLLKTKEYIELLDPSIQIKLFDIWNDKIRDFDILHVFGSKTSCHSIISLAKEYKVKVVISPILFYNPLSYFCNIHNLFSDRKKLWEYIYFRSMGKYSTTKGKMLRSADLLLPNSFEEAKLIQKLFNIPINKMSLIPNGVDIHLFKNGEFLIGDDKLRFKSIYDFLDKFNEYVLCIGRIEKRKNQLRLIYALKDLNYPVLIVGKVTDEEYYRKCLDIASKTNHIYIEDVFIPHDSILLSLLYTKAKVFILPSLYETPGLAALEAGLAKSTIVITKYGGTHEYFGDHAFYINPNSCKDIREKTLLAINSVRNTTLQKHIENNFSWEITAQKTIENYKKILN